MAHHYVDVVRIRQLVAQGYSQRAIAKELGISRTAYQRLVKVLKAPGPPALPTPALQQILQRLQQVENALRQGPAGPGANLQGPNDPSVRWSIRVPRSMVQRMHTLATARKQRPSRLVQEALQHWLAGQ